MRRKAWFSGAELRSPRLEDDNANLRTRNLELFNRNTDLSNQLAPFKMPRRRDHRGWFISAKQMGAQA